MTAPPSAMTLDTLREASTLLRTAHHVRAQHLLGDLLSVVPDLAEAHWLLARSFAETRDVAGAQRELRMCVRLAPDKPDAYIALGRLLASNGQAEEAERTLRQALRLDGASVVAVSALARLLLIRGRADAARVVVESALPKIAATPEVLTLYADALMALGNKSRAAAAFSQILSAEPDNREARLRLAAVLADNDQPVEAEAEVRAAMAMGGQTVDAAFVLARALMGQNRFVEAETELARVVRVRPDHVVAQGNLSELVWMRGGNLDEAGAALDSALRRNPRLSALRIAKARLLLAARLPDQALEVINAGLAFAESELALLNAAAEVALGFDAVRALDYAARALRVSPEHHSALLAFGNASLASGNARQALDTSEKLRRLAPNDGQALAMASDALRMLDDDRHYALADYAHFVTAGIIDTPEGWPDLPTYLTDLVCDIDRLHGQGAHPIGQSLRNGSQVNLPLDQPMTAPIRAFVQAIDEPIRRYIAALGSGTDAVRRRNTGRYQIHSAWSVRLRPDGFHTSHYHPNGWLSSACYLHLPSAVGSHEGQGWLHFGKPPFPTAPELDAEYVLKPELGLLALFPSYMWHGTVPFSGSPNESRLTIAFDVVPA